MDSPSAPFISDGHDDPANCAENPSLAKDVSLSVNYLSFEFSSSLLSPEARRRKGKSDLPKQGSGRESFKSDEPRMPAEEGENYNGITEGWFGGKDGGHTRPRMRWNRFKWTLFVANVCVRSRTLPIPII